MLHNKTGVGVQRAAVTAKCAVPIAAKLIWRITSPGVIVSIGTTIGRALLGVTRSCRSVLWPRWLKLRTLSKSSVATREFASIRQSLYFRIEGPGTAPHPGSLRRMAPPEREEPPVCDCNRNDSLRPGESSSRHRKFLLQPFYFFGEPLCWFPDHAHSAVAPVFHQCTGGKLLVKQRGD